MTSPEEPNKQAELLKYGTEQFHDYVDPETGDVMPLSNLTPAELDEALQSYAKASSHDAVQDDKTPPAKVRKALGRRAYGRPPVGEEGRLLNVEDHSGAQTSEDIAVSRAAGNRREKEIMIRLQGEMEEARERGDTETAARIWTKMEARRERRRQLGFTDDD